MPAFSGVLFVIDTLWVCFFFLKNDYKLIIGLNKVYDHLSLKLLLRFNKFILKTFSIHWMRVSFRGKGFRLRKFKKLNKLTLNFGHSHWARVALLNNFFFFKKLRRQNYLCVCRDYSIYKTFKLHIKKMKTLNMYTKRGLRLKKQYIRKRFGKISQVVSSLH